MEPGVVRGESVHLISPLGLLTKTVAWNSFSTQPVLPQERKMCHHSMHVRPMLCQQDTGPRLVASNPIVQEI
jgi:hypothetical protein